MGCFDNIEDFREEKRYLKKDNTTGVRGMYADYWKNYVNLYGIQTGYYRHGYNLSSQDDFLYGEDATESFYNPLTLNMIVEYQTDAILLSKFGIESTADLTAIVVVKDFESKFGIGVEPKAGDIIELTEAAWYTSEMNPPNDQIVAMYNIVSHNLDNYTLEVGDVTLTSTTFAPIKMTVSETELSFFTPLYTPSVETTAVSAYPIAQDLVEVTGSISATDTYISMDVGSNTYFVPLYTPSISVTSVSSNALFFQHDIVDLNGEDLIEAGNFVFSYQGGQLFMPMYEYSSQNPASATIVSSPTDYYDYTTKELLCMYQDAGYVASLQIELSAVYGSPYIRYPQLFEITEVKYQDYSQQGMNFAQGHYIWLIHGKRFDYSFEPNAPTEGPFDQVYDSTFAGIVSATDAPSSDGKVYDQNIDDASVEVWDYEDKGTDTGPYGYY